MTKVSKTNTTSSSVSLTKRTTASISQTASQAPAKKRTGTVKKVTPTKTIAPASVKPISKTRVKPAKPAVSAPAAPKAKPVKEKKVKVVRDSFTIPKSEFTQIADMKKRAMALGVDIKKSELIRAGLQAIFALSDAGFKKALSAVPTLKTGRPSKS
jgi:hypothetical protein